MSKFRFEGECVFVYMNTELADFRRLLYYSNDGGILVLGMDYRDQECLKKQNRQRKRKKPYLID